jgi:hypothetical protein
LGLDGPKRLKSNRLEAIVGSKNDPNQRGDPRQDNSSANETVPPFQSSGSHYYRRYHKAHQQSLRKRRVLNGRKVVLRLLISALKCSFDGWHKGFERNCNLTQLFWGKSLCVNHARQRRSLRDVYLDGLKCSLEFTLRC